MRRLPGGVALLSDIRHLDDYRRAFARAGWSAAVEGSVAARVLLAMVTFGSLRPGVVRAVRPI